MSPPAFPRAEAPPSRKGAARTIRYSPGRGRQAARAFWSRLTNPSPPGVREDTTLYLPASALALAIFARMALAIPESTVSHTRRSGHAGSVFASRAGVVRGGGFEPPCPRAPAPKAGASAGSAILARRSILYHRARTSTSRPDREGNSILRQQHTSTTETRRHGERPRSGSRLTSPPSVTSVVEWRMWAVAGCESGVHVADFHHGDTETRRTAGYLDPAVRAAITDQRSASRMRLDGEILREVVLRVSVPPW